MSLIRRLYPHDHDDCPCEGDRGIQLFELSRISVRSEIKLARYYKQEGYAFNLTIKNSIDECFN